MEMIEVVSGGAEKAIRGDGRTTLEARRRQRVKDRGASMEAIRPRGFFLVRCFRPYSFFSTDT